MPIVQKLEINDHGVVLEPERADQGYGQPEKHDQRAEMNGKSDTVGHGNDPENGLIEEK